MGHEHEIMKMTFAALRLVWLLVVVVVLIPVAWVMGIFTPAEEWPELGQKIKRFVRSIS